VAAIVEPVHVYKEACLLHRHQMLLECQRLLAHRPCTVPVLSACVGYVVALLRCSSALSSGMA